MCGSGLPAAVSLTESYKRGIIHDEKNIYQSDGNLVLRLNNSGDEFFCFSPGIQMAQTG